MSVVKKVPLVLQMEAVECGAACLTMILGYYGKWISLEEARIKCGISRDGSKASSIKKAAESYGIKVSGYKMGVEAFRKNVKFPCICFFDYEHFVVVTGIKHNKVYINDPGRGKIVLPFSQFEEHYSSVVLEFVVGENFVPGGKRDTLIDVIKRNVGRNKKALYFTAAITFVLSLTGIAMPKLQQLFVDEVLPGNNERSTHLFFGGMIFITIINFAMSFLSAKYMQRLNAHIAARGRSDFMKHLLKLPLEFFSQRSSGELKGRAETNEEIANNFVNILAPLYLQSIFMIIYVVVLVRYDVFLGLISFASVLINVILGYFISEKQGQIAAVRMINEGKAEGYAYYGISMVETIKAGGAAKDVFDKWAELNDKVINDKKSSQRLNNTLGALPEFLMSFTTVLIIMLGLVECVKGKMTTGMLLGFQGVLSAMFVPVTQLIESADILREMDAQARRMEDVMEYPEDDIIKEGNEGTTYEKLTGSLEMSNVSFGYAPLGEPIIKDFSVKVEPGKSVAFVGGSGSGKSTIAKLISGMYRTWSGEIKIGGKSIYDIDRNSLRGTVGVVDQDIIMFEDTLENNIKMWDNTIEDFEMILGAKDAGIHEEIMDRPLGYRHKIAEGGKDFSGGQRQRLEIARALALDPHILILDEATSALDAMTEKKVVDAIKARGVTLVVVAHRLSTIRDCDEIIVLDHGNVVERGTHDELMAQKGAYYNLVYSD